MLPESKAPPVLEAQAYLVPLVSKVPQALKVLLEQQAYLARPVLPEQLEFKVLRGYLDPPELQVLQA